MKRNEMPARGTQEKIFEFSFSDTKISPLRVEKNDFNRIVMLAKAGILKRKKYDLCFKIPHAFENGAH